MNRLWKFALLAAFVCVGASAQTPSDHIRWDTYNIPAFNGAASLGGSPIYASGNNVGIGTAAPTMQNQDSTTSGLGIMPAPSDAGCRPTGLRKPSRFRMPS